MSRTLLNKITLALTIVGCIIALVLTYEHFFPVADIGCGAMGGNCHTTIESKYGKLGPIPTSILGLGMYLTLAGLCVLRARSLAGGTATTPGSDEKPLSLALFGISLLAFCISWWLQFASFFVIFSFCPWCFASALTVTAIFLVNSYDYLILGRALTGEQKMLTGVVLFIGAMLAFMYAPQVMFQVRMVIRPPVERIKPPDMGRVHPVGDHPREEILREGLVFKGKPTATYTIVEFADYGCGHCKEASENMDRLLKEFPDRYRLAFRNFPLGRWQWSIPEAAAAEAAAKQGKFWEMHDIMFANQAEIDDPTFGVDRIMAWAKSIGLDVQQLKKDMNTPAMHDRITRDHEIAQINNVIYTPSFFIIPSDPNGKVRMIVGPADAKAILPNPNDPFWSGNMSSIKTPETSATLAPQ